MAAGDAGTKPGPSELSYTWPRFFAHWIAATFGCFLRSFLPVLKTWLDPKAELIFLRWWVALMLAACCCLVGGVINANLPYRSRELLKSVCRGFALDVVAPVAKLGG